MRTIGTVCRKEILETARDRRTLVSLLLGPLLGPALFATVINIAVSQATLSVEQGLSIPMPGLSQAPNLEAFLRAQGIAPSNEDTIVTVEDAAAAVRARRSEVVLVIHDDYARNLRAAESARVTLVFDSSSSQAASRIARVRGAVNAYALQLGTLRLVALGIEPALLRPVGIDELDVSTAAGRSALLLGMLTYFLLFATLAGGLHLAIDSTAGERERKSLEPLLTLPVQRAELLLGKMAATAAYMLLALALTLAAFSIAFGFLPLDEMGMGRSFGLTTPLAVFAVLVPFAPLGAALMTVVASFTRTYKEAQTYLTFVLLVPTLPLVFATMLSVEPRASLMWIPSLSQHLQIIALIRDEPLALGLVLLSAASTLAFGALLGWVAVRFYRREGLLG